jgi:hypothetical protein
MYGLALNHVQAAVPQWSEAHAGMEKTLKKAQGVDGPAPHLRACNLHPPCRSAVFLLFYANTSFAYLMYSLLSQDTFRFLLATSACPYYNLRRSSWKNSVVYLHVVCLSRTQLGYTSCAVNAKVKTVHFHYSNIYTRTYCKIGRSVRMHACTCTQASAHARMVASH